MSKGMENEELLEVKNTPMLFVLGKWRSGTTLLQNLLDAHPGIVGAPEARFAVLLYPRFGHIKKWKKADVLHFVECLQIDPLFTQLWKIDKNLLICNLLSAAPFADYSWMCKIVYHQMKRDKTQLLYFSDKNPHYLLFIRTILKIFPDSKFIHIVREPRDNVYSHMAAFHAKNSIFKAYQWLMFNKIVEKHKQEIPERYFTVIYENLVRNTENVMNEVCKFLHVSFTAAMTQNTTPEWLKGVMVKNNLTENSSFIHQNLLKSINASNIGKWKGRMEPFAQVVVEKITGNYASVTYGYDFSDSVDNEKVSVSSFTLFKGKLFYYCWQILTRTKYKSLWFNVAYQKFKRFRSRKPLPLWEYF